MSTNQPDHSKMTNAMESNNQDSNYNFASQQLMSPNRAAMLVAREKQRFGNKSKGDSTATNVETDIMMSPTSTDHHAIENAPGTKVIGHRPDF